MQVPLKNWVIVSTKRDSSKTHDFSEMMKRVCPSMGIEVCLWVAVMTDPGHVDMWQVSDPKVLHLPDDRTDTYLHAVRQEVKQTLQLVVAVFPTSRDDRYSAFKKLCCIQTPIPSQVNSDPLFELVCDCVVIWQVINARTISQQQKLRSVTQKIALQINCKLGGELWAVDIPLVRIVVFVEK